MNPMGRLVYSLVCGCYCYVLTVFTFSKLPYLIYLCVQVNHMKFVTFFTKMVDVQIEVDVPLRPQTHKQVILFPDK